MTVTIHGTNGITAPGTETFGDGTALGGATNPIVSMAKGANNYIQSYIVNNTNGTSSSADFVAYPSNGNDSHGWVDMGITSLGYADTTYTVTGPNESYLFASAPSGSSTTGNLVIATDNTGTANSIQFYTNGFTQAKSAAKMVIDGSTGNVGIGTSSPSGKLDVYNSAFGGNYTTIYLSSVNSSSAKINYAGLGYECSQGAAGIEAGALIFRTYGSGALSERARIDSGGNFLVGATSVGGNGSLSLVPNNSSGAASIYWNRATTAAITYATIFQNASTWVGTVSYTNTATSYNTSSDYRLKENVQPMIGALAKVARLKPCTYTWKVDGSAGQGFIAHELQAVVPDAVHGEKDAVNEDGSIKPQGIDTSFLVATLTAAIQELATASQEQQALISSQAAVITSLTERITALENK